METLFLWIRLSCEVWPEDLPELPMLRGIDVARRNLKPSEPVETLGGYSGIGYICGLMRTPSFDLWEFGR